MREINLSTKELLVLASHVGAGNFYGIKDPFCGMSRQEIEAAIPSIQLALEQKGYASVGFDSTFQINSDVKNTVSVCAQCDKYIMVDMISAGARTPKEMLYFSTGHCIKLTQSDAGVSLSETTPESFVDRLLETVFQSYSDNAYDTGSITLSKTVLDVAKKKSLEDSKLFLQSHGCSPAIASIITEGLHQLCTTLSLVAVDLNDHTLEALICIVSQSASVSMRLDDLGAQDNWCVNWLSHKEFEKELRQIVSVPDCRGVG